MCVGIQEKDGIPPDECVSHQAVDFRRLELHSISIQIEVLPVISDPDALLGTDLSWAVLRADLVVAVGVEDGHEEDDETIEVVGSLAVQDVPGEH